MNDSFDGIRVINLVALSLVGIGLIVSAVFYRHRAVNLKGVALFFFVLSGIYGTAEALVTTASPGLRAVAVLFVALIAILLVYVPLFESLAAYRKRRKQGSPPR